MTAGGPLAVAAFMMASCQARTFLASSLIGPTFGFQVYGYCTVIRGQNRPKPAMLNTLAHW